MIDQRRNLTINRLPEMMQGEHDELIDTLIREDQTDQLAGLVDPQEAGSTAGRALDGTAHLPARHPRSIIARPSRSSA